MNDDKPIPYSDLPRWKKIRAWIAYIAAIIIVSLVIIILVFIIWNLIMNSIFSEK